MSDYTFTHGGDIECPECPGFGKRNRKPRLICVQRNYSGCSVDYGYCEECGKAWCISYKVDNLKRDKAWDMPSRKEREAEEANEKLEEEKKERAELARLKTKYDPKPTGEKP
jgi:hypothetical protein